eukprot:CAMPEP_0182441202 /NCGR_PEP_ID=MMETSP1172-20130603/140_1 /TAXON_ID=708627 /ORGANISM="Timspurckia oligopyrenoides, Strain CCMP3278" /LENGTH=327 /DNA_ID=CAMNT_0024635369 /DNA_START=174 /DNA_END=1157 /DNA_ORIENTATION=+
MNYFANEQNDSESQSQSVYTDVTGMQFDEDPIDFGQMALPELLNEISPDLMNDMNRDVPEVLSALLERDSFFMTRSDSLGNSGGFENELVMSNNSPLPHQFPSNARSPRPQVVLPQVVDESMGKRTKVKTQKSTSSRGKAAKGGGSVGGNQQIVAAAEQMEDGSRSAVGTASSASRKRTKNGVASGKSMGNGGKRISEEEVYDDEMGEDDGVDQIEKKPPVVRAERNRQSAAASRERKKHHIEELERRVSMLSSENAQLQVEQLQTLRTRIQKEKELLEENKRLKKKIVIQDMKIEKLAKKLNDAGINDEHVKRPSTWAGSDWGKKR